MENEKYVTVQQAIAILGVTRQSIHYLKKHHLLKDFKVIHSKCYLYSKDELLTLKSQGYGKL